MVRGVVTPGPSLPAGEGYQCRAGAMGRGPGPPQPSQRGGRAAGACLCFGFLQVSPHLAHLNLGSLGMDLPILGDGAVLLLNLGKQGKMAELACCVS